MSAETEPDPITANETEEIARLYTAMADACERGGWVREPIVLQCCTGCGRSAALHGVRLYRNPGGRETRCGDCIRELRARSSAGGGIRP